MPHLSIIPSYSLHRWVSHRFSSVRKGLTLSANLQPLLRGCLSTFASTISVTMISRLILNLRRSADGNEITTVSLGSSAPLSGIPAFLPPRGIGSITTQLPVQISVETIRTHTDAEFVKDDYDMREVLDVRARQPDVYEMWEIPYREPTGPQRV